MFRSCLSRCAGLARNVLLNGELSNTTDAGLHVLQPWLTNLRCFSRINNIAGLDVDRKYDAVRNQDFAPISLKESTPKTGLTNLSTPEYAKRRHMVFDGVPYYDLPVCYIQARWNNTIVAMYQERTATGKSKRYCRVSCRSVGIFNAKKKTELAGETVGQAAAERGRQNHCHPYVRVVIKGIGPGRNPTMRGLLRGGMTIVSVTDVTPITNNGLPQRPRKIRRV